MNVSSKKKKQFFGAGGKGWKWKGGLGWPPINLSVRLCSHLHLPRPRGSWTQTATPPLSKAVGNWVLHQKLLHFRLETLKNYMLLLYFNTEVYNWRRKQTGSNYSRSPLLYHCSSPISKESNPFLWCKGPTHPIYFLFEKRKLVSNHNAFLYSLRILIWGSNLCNIDLRIKFV